MSKASAEKYCYACKQTLLSNAFGKNKSKKDGLCDECKSCKKLSDAKSHQTHREYRLKKMQEYRTIHKDELQEKARQHSRSEKGREINNKATRRYYRRHRETVLDKCKQRNLNNPEKYIAEYTVSNAIKLGKLIRPDICQKCGRAGHIEAHHPDYSKSLSVVWLCKKCHGKEHRKVR